MPEEQSIKAGDLHPEGKTRTQGRKRSIFDRILDYTFGICIVIAAFMLVSTFLDVSLRCLFKKPIAGMTEINILLLVWLPFLGGAYGLRIERHVILESLVDALKPRPRALLTFFTSIIGILTSIYMVYYGTIVTINFFSRNVLHEATIIMPFGLYTAAIPIGGLLLLVQFIRRTILYLDMWKGKIPATFAKTEP
jgi:C4-dicarboxylate transporter, DctQ subunit